MFEPFNEFIRTPFLGKFQLGTSNTMNAEKTVTSTVDRYSGKLLDNQTYRIGCNPCA